MKEKIKTILESEELDASSKTDAIAKIIGEETVIKSKYNEKNAELILEREAKENISKELENVKASTMTDAERIKKQEEVSKTREKEFLLKSNRLDAKDIFVSAGLKEEEYKDIIDDYISEDAELTKKRVTGFVDLLNKTKETTTTKVREELLKSTPRPDAGGQPGKKELTKEDFAKMSGFEKTDLFRTNKELFDKLTAQEK